MEREKINDTIIYTLNDNKKIIENITLNHISIFYHSAVGTSDVVDKIIFNNKFDIPTVNIPFCCFITADCNVEHWEYI